MMRGVRISDNSADIILCNIENTNSIVRVSFDSEKANNAHSILIMHLQYYNLVGTVDKYPTRSPHMGLPFNCNYGRICSSTLCFVLVKR